MPVCRTVNGGMVDPFGKRRRSARALPKTGGGTSGFVAVVGRPDRRNPRNVPARSGCREIEAPAVALGPDLADGGPREMGGIDHGAAIGIFVQEIVARFARQIRIGAHRARQTGLVDLQRLLSEIPGGLQ